MSIPTRLQVGYISQAFFKAQVQSKEIKQIKEINTSLNKECQSIENKNQKTEGKTDRQRNSLLESIGSHMGSKKEPSKLEANMRDKVVVAISNHGEQSANEKCQQSQS